ncbi:Stf0 family sulfotransferase [Thalassotalea euphylliae]|uniref:Stf0 family sulfotransferase n=1 Tax=Thalassotalea euphylliae TaxID=1655234 RepID=UPI0036366D1B
MALYENQFSEEHDFVGTVEPSKTLVIASTGRSGSHMLGHALHQTGKFGFPLEYANPANLEKWRSLLGVSDVADVMTQLKRRRTSSNGVFGIKVHYPHIEQFNGFANLLDTFPEPYFVFLSRKDLLKQAVSLSIARQTGVWISGQESNGVEPKYDFHQIDGCLKETIRHNASWKYKLSISGAKYMELDFDKVRMDLKHAIHQIAQFMEVELKESDIPVEQVTRKQGNNLNKEWESRFLRECDLEQILYCDSDHLQKDSLIKAALKRYIKK